MSDSGSSWWLGADRLWRKGQPPSGWHQTRDGLWHPPPTAATRLKAETPSPSRVRVGAHAGTPATATLPGERWRAAAEAYNRTTGDLDDEDAGPDAGAADDEDGEGSFADFDGYETAYYERADAYGRELSDAGDDSDVDDDDGYDEAGRARHMAGGGPPELWANLIDRVLAWPTWVRVALPASAMVILLSGLGIAVAGGAGSGRAERAGGTDGDGSSVDQTDGDSDGLTTTSSSSLSTTTTGPGTSTSSSTTNPSGATTSVPGSTASGNGTPTGDGAAPPPPPSPPDPTTPTSSSPRPPSTTTPTTAPQDPYRYCEGLERLFPTDPDGDGTFCE